MTEHSYRHGADRWGFHATGAGKSVLLARMALQFRRYPNSQVFAFDFGASIRAAAFAMAAIGTISAVHCPTAAKTVAIQPLARIDDPLERGWATEWIGAILAREKIDHPGGQGSSAVGADVSRFGADAGTHSDGPLGSPAHFRCTLKSSKV